MATASARLQGVQLVGDMLDLLGGHLLGDE
jgi:hypothetical protein